MVDLGRHRDSRLLTAGSAISALGNAITPVALAFAVVAEVVTTLFGGVVGGEEDRPGQPGQPGPPGASRWPP